MAKIDPKKCIVYGLIRKSERKLRIRYIGQTTNFSNRKANHKLSAAKIGRKIPKSVRLKMSMADRSLYPKNRKPFSEEYKKQVSERVKLWWANKKAGTQK